MAITIDKIELLALKKLAVINGALAKQFTGSTAREQLALTNVLVEIITRAEVDNASTEAMKS
jgi:hypothetical protein